MGNCATQQAQLQAYDEKLCLDQPDTGDCTHVCFLVHGLNGAPQDLTFMRKQLQFRFGTKLYVHTCASNVNNTLDGVIEGGKRIAAEVEMVILGLGAKNTESSLRHVSFSCHCIGGLYARYACTLLQVHQLIMLDMSRPK